MTTATKQRSFTSENEMTANALAERDSRPAQQSDGEALTPMALIQQAMASGITPDDLGKLFEMHKDHEANCARKAYAAAMTKAQGEMRPVVRNRTNQQQNSKYAALEDIHDVIKPIWLANGFTLSYGSDQSPYPEHYRVTCDCLHEGGHVTHHVLDGPGDEKGIKGNANKTPIQALTSTVTYLRRSLAVMIFDVTLVGADHDGQSAVRTITQEQEVTIREWMEQKSVKLEDFLGWAGIAQISDLPVQKFSTAMDMLKRRKAGSK